MNFNDKSVKVIQNYLEGLEDEELLRTLKILGNDNRKSIQALILKHQKLLAKRSTEKQRLLKLWSLEKELYQQDFQYVVGIDEAGRGPLAGPVVAGAVILPPYCHITGLNDSKKLSPTRRLCLASEIKKKALAWAVGVVDAQTIDRLNILEATRYAMSLALKSLNIDPQYALVDGDKNPKIKIPQSGIVKGDSRSASIAAASIIAKVHRDKIMLVYDQIYPQYKFIEHKGYGTKQHLEALKTRGPSPIHRFSFRPVYIEQNNI